MAKIIRFSTVGIWLWLALLLCGPAFAGDAKFSAALDRDSIVLGETVTLSLRFENGQPGGLPGIPSVPGLQVAGAVSSSTEQRIEGGAMTSTTTYSLPLAPQRAGDFVIPPITAQIDGQNVASQPLRLRVLASDPSAPPAEYAQKLAFLWPVLPKKEVYLGEVLVVEMRLYVRGDVVNVSDLRIPPLRGDGFISLTSDAYQQSHQYQRRVGNAQFGVYPILTAIAALKTGDMALGPMNGSVVANMPGRGRRPSNPFDIDIDSFFGPRTQPQQVALALEQQTIHIIPVPTENVPAGFSGAVGNYTMSFSAGPTNVAAGDPITVKMTVSGQGNLDSVAMPDLSGWKEFKSYPPATRAERDKLGAQGTKFFEQLVTPQSVEVKELPGVSFSFFDPDKKAFQTLKQAPTPLTVRPAGAVPMPTVAASRATGENAPPTQDIVPIKQRFGTVAQVGAPLVSRAWFLALQAIPLAGWLSLLVWRKRVDTFANNPRLRRQRMVAQIVQNGMGQLRRLAAENKSDDFFATLFRLLQEQLGERLDLPATAITEAVVEDELKPRGLQEGTLSDVQEFFQMCNLARYAPVRSSQELAAIVPRFETVMNGLREAEL
jgi:hypothetical protein